MNGENEDQGKVVFEESGWNRRSYQPEQKTPAMIEWVINHSGGKITNANQAGTFLIVFIIVALLTSFILFSSGNNDVEPPRGALKNPQYGLPEPD